MVFKSFKQFQEHYYPKKSDTDLYKLPLSEFIKHLVEKHLKLLQQQV